jgi:hypothetical protein
MGLVEQSVRDLCEGMKKAALDEGLEGIKKTIEKLQGILELQGVPESSRRIVQETIRDLEAQLPEPR